MSLKEHVFSVLIVSSAEKFNSALKQLLPEKEYRPIHVVGSTGAARRRILERSYDLVLVNTPLPDDFGRTFAIDVSNDNSSVVTLFVKSEQYSEIYAGVVDYGVMILQKPMTKPMLQQGLDYMTAMRERLRRFEKKTMSLEEKMAEIRVVNRAKWALIECCKMTEADAHRFIEKQAMDRCVTRGEVAENILKTYK